MSEIVREVVKQRARIWLAGLLASFLVPILAVVGLSVALLLVIGVSSDNSSTATCNSSGNILIDGKPISAEQTYNAEVIVGIGTARGLGQRDILLGLMIALQEARLTNPAGGDADSVGIFQQRPSQGWGTAEQIQDPVYATDQFYDHLETVIDRNQLSLLEVALIVQNPDPALYAATFDSWQPVAQQILDQVTSGSTQDIATAGCSGGQPDGTIQQAVAYAVSAVGTPYVWGGASEANGFDCSGLVWWAYGQAGIAMPRVAADQYNAGQHVLPNQLMPGDLVFWATDVNDPTTIHHVAIYLGDGKIIDAPHTGELVQIQNMFWNGYIGATRVETNP